MTKQEVKKEIKPTPLKKIDDKHSPVTIKNIKDIIYKPLVRTKSRNKSMDNFMKFQWGWTV